MGELPETVGAEPRLGDRFIQVVDPLQRVLIRVARSTAGLPALTEAHATLLRLLEAKGPLSPAQTAAELHLARPTVSNLVRELAANGFVERQPSVIDGRSVLLALTNRARNQLQVFGRRRSLVLEDALAELSAKDREALAAALPALSQVLDRLTCMAAETADDDGECA